MVVGGKRLSLCGKFTIDAQGKWEEASAEQVAKLTEPVQTASVGLALSGNAIARATSAKNEGSTSSKRESLSSRKRSVKRDRNKSNKQPKADTLVTHRQSVTLPPL